MPKILKLAVSQSHTLPTTTATLSALHKIAQQASIRGIDLLLFPEAYLGGYPRTCSFGATVGSRSVQGHDQYLQYFQSAIDLGDTPQGGYEAWLDRTLPLARGAKYRGDGIREEVEHIARETGVFLVVGLVERAGGSLYCAVVYVCPELGIIGKRRKVMPTGAERVIWAQGSPRTLKAVTTTIKRVRLCLAAAICWENYMPLLRQALYMQDVNLWLAPTADARGGWEALMRTVACEGRSWVLSANMCTRGQDLPGWIREEEEGGEENVGGVGKEKAKDLAQQVKDVKVVDESMLDAHMAKETGQTGLHDTAIPVTTAQPATDNSTFSSNAKQNDNDFVCRGGSCIVSPSGDVMAGPVWERQDELLIVDADFEDCERGRLDMDVAGSYSRAEFKLTVDGLDLVPPP